MSLTPGTGRPTLADISNRGIFFRMESDPVVRVWSGVGKVRVAPNELDATAQVYDGLGLLRNIPEIDRLINGEARRLTITLSGLTQEAADLVDSDMVGMDDCRARIGHLRYDRNWRPLSEIRWAWDGLVDEVGIEATQTKDGHEWTLSLSMSSAYVTRNRAALQYYTPKDRALVSPTDRAFDLVPSYNAGTTRLYPPR